MNTIIWDWNGTLLDDPAVCLGVMNRMLARRGLPELADLDRYREIFTFPVKDYYVLAGLDLTKEPFEDLAVEFMEDYTESAKACSLRPGAVEAIQAIHAMGLRQVVASASEQGDLERQLGEQGLAGSFHAVLGIADRLAGGKAGLAQAWMEREHIAKEDVLFVGDSLHDWEVAESLHCKCVLLAGGHQNEARLRTAGVPVLSGPKALVSYIQTKLLPI